MPTTLLQMANQMSDATTVGEYLRNLIRRARENDDSDAEDANSAIIYLCRGLLDRIDESVDITEQRRRVIASGLTDIAGDYDAGRDVTDDISSLADKIRSWN